MMQIVLNKLLLFSSKKFFIVLNVSLIIARDYDSGREVINKLKQIINEINFIKIQ